MITNSDGSCTVPSNPATKYKAYNRLSLFVTEDGGAACGYVVSAHATSMGCFGTFCIIQPVMNVYKNTLNNNPVKSSTGSTLDNCVNGTVYTNYINFTMN